MGYNTRTFDKETYYGAMTTNELEKLKNETEDFVSKHPEHFFAVEHLAYLKMKIAERIGAKK